MVFMVPINTNKRDNIMFDEYAKKYYDKIFSYSYRRLNFNKQAAEDCTQQVFMTFYESLDKLGDTNYLGAWLYKTAENFINRYFTKQAHEDKVLMYPYNDDMQESELYSYEENYEAFLEREIDIGACKKIILENLGKEDITLWYLYFKEGNSINDTAEIMSIPPSSVKSRIYRLKHKIKKLVKQTIESQEIYNKI